MRTTLKTLILAGACALIGATSALAGSTGFDSIHMLKREQRKLCMADHFHYGYGQSDKSRKLAEKEAIRAWADFVQLEYGSDWSRFSLAGSKSVSCSRTNGIYSCNVSGRPCRR